ncbi:MAG: acyltransferase [Spirochaetaceae bacterium]|nr:acyltransferase [Spirochaetaceae bacterium]
MITKIDSLLPVINKDNNFNFLRLFFAFSVAIGHSFYSGGLSLPRIIQTISIIFNGHVAVCGFFIISGFLITRSYALSSNIKEYFAKRCRRLLPAYCLVIMLCAVSLALISNLPAREYFTSPGLYKYIIANLLFLNFLHPGLPGVFGANASGSGVNKDIFEINGSLWTIRIEVIFYILIPLIVFAIAKLKTRRRVNAVLAAAYVFGFLYSILWGLIAQNSEIYLLKGIRESSDYVAYFVTGIFCLINLEWIKKYQKYLIVPGMIIVILEYLFTFNTALEFFLPAALGVVIMFVAFNFPSLQSVGKYGDYSYGIYIFHGPLIKVFITFGFYDLNNIVVIFAVIGTVFSISYMSWHFVEKKALKYR